MTALIIRKDAGGNDGNADAAAADADAALSLARQAERAVSWRVLPVLLLVVMVSFIDRTNLSFASVTMNADLGFSPSVYGIAAGCFSLGYALGQVPSNIALLRLGAPVWLATICVAWGVTAGAFAYVRSAGGFIALRLLLGLCEAGSVPGVWAVVGHLYPPDRTTLPLVVIETGITASQVLGAPLAAALLALDGALGLKGWQLLFLAEAVPALLLAGLVLVAVPRSVRAARFLTPPQAAALRAAIVAAEAAAAAPSTNASSGNGAEGGAVQRLIEQQRNLVGGGGGGGGSCSDEERALVARGANAFSSPGQLGGDGGSDDGGQQQQQQQRHQHHRHQYSLTASAACAQQEEAGARVSSSSAPPALADGGPRRAAFAAGVAGGGYAPVDVGGGGGGGGGGRARRLRASIASGFGDVPLRAALAAACRPIVLYAGTWRVLHDVGGAGLMFFTPLIIVAMTGGEGGAPEGGGGGGGAPLPVPGDHGGGGVAGHAAASVALLAAVPYLVTTLVHLLNGWHSQRVNERRLHLGLCFALGAAALLAMPLAMGPRGSPGAAFALLVLSHTGLNGANGVQTSWVAAFLEGPGKAVGLAAYNTLGQLGSFLGPYAVGALRQATGGYAAALALMGACLAASAAMVLALSESWARGGPWRVPPRKQGGARAAVGMPAPPRF